MRGKDMDNGQRSVAKVQLMSQMQAGYSWQTAAAKAGKRLSQSNAYRLMKAFRQRGEAPLSDGWHGHPSKLRGTARTFLAEQCQQAPQTPSSVIQVELRERFDLHVSVSQINRVRAALGISNHPKAASRREKRQRREAPSLDQNGRKALGVSCCLLELRKQICFPA